MPFLEKSKTNYQKPVNISAHSIMSGHILFIPLICVVAVAWILYRVFFDFPIWVDETLGKAFFFGFPVWFYMVVTRFRAIPEALSYQRMKPGVLLGLAIGGIYGFTTSIVSFLQSDLGIQASVLFGAPGFWNEFFLGILTGFWESLFFFVFVGSVIFDKYKHRAFVLQLILIVLIFVLFHIPNTLLLFDQSMVPGQVIVLSFFALGQALVYYRWRNIYTLILSHAIWGLTLLFYT